MFEASCVLFLCAETPLHPGTGRGLGGVDLPIQRERVTNYPIVQGSSLKGCLRAAARDKLEPQELDAIFGPEADPSVHAGALVVGDARVLLFPVRSLAGVFAWTTSVHALAFFQREAAMANIPMSWSVPTAPEKDEALVCGSTLKEGDTVVLEEFNFIPKEVASLADIGRWLGSHALLERSDSGQDEYGYWRSALLDKLCVLQEDAFRDFLQYATEVQTHIRLKKDTKTVEERGLWTQENLPVDTLLYAPLLASKSRKTGVNWDAEKVIGKLRSLGIERLQLGGDETTGQGIVAFRFYGGTKP